MTSVHPVFDVRIFYKECMELKKNSYEVTLITRHDTNEIINGINILSVKKSKNRLHRIFISTWKIYNIANKLDARIYHFHDPELIFVGLLLKWKGKKVIYDVHEDLPMDILIKEWIFPLFRRTASVIIDILEGWAARRLSYVIAATPHIRDRFIKKGAKVVDVNNYPIMNEFNGPMKDFLRKDRAVCYVGGITYIRGIQEMVKAIGETNGRLLLAGEFSPASLRDKICELPGWRKVQEFGHVSRGGVSDILSRSMAGLVTLHPTKTFLDSLPTKLFEYMSAGIPVIASNFPLWKELTEENECGICVEPLDPSTIAKAIQWIFDHPNEAGKMGENGRRVVAEKYCWERESRKLLDVYRELG